MAIAPGMKPQRTARTGWWGRLWNILVEPKAEWAAIEAEPDTVRGLMLRWVAPLAAIGPLAKFGGSQLFGYNQYGADIRPPLTTALTELIVSYVLSLGVVYVLARLINALAVNFGGREDRVQAMKAAAYGGTAAYLAGGFQLVPPIEWMGVIGLYSLYLMFTGLPAVMHVPRRKVFIFTVVTLLAGIGLTILLTLTVMWTREAFTPEFPEAAYNYTPPG